eukprot:COSAG01_NODE_390_length_17672_cov_8.513287_3_plen_185_part_00
MLAPCPSLATTFIRSPASPASSTIQSMLFWYSNTWFVSTMIRINHAREPKPEPQPVDLLIVLGRDMEGRHCGSGSLAHPPALALSKPPLLHCPPGAALPISDRDNNFAFPSIEDEIRQQAKLRRKKESPQSRCDSETLNEHTYANHTVYIEQMGIPLTAGLKSIAVCGPTFADQIEKGSAFTCM